jgi:septum formation protein
MKIILGSQSQGRKNILSKMGYKFDVIAANIDEKSIRRQNPIDLTLTLANTKADALLPKITEAAILITADQVVLCNNSLREKPSSPEEARLFLNDYMSYPAETISAIVVTNTITKRRVSGVDIAKIWFTKLPETIIEKLIANKNIYSFAGGFSIDDPLLKKYIAKIEGTPDSITGLPIKLTKKLIHDVQQISR